MRVNPLIRGFGNIAPNLIERRKMFIKYDPGSENVSITFSLFEVVTKGRK
jgi:hypothetical protein